MKNFGSSRKICNPRLGFLEQDRNLSKEKREIKSKVPRVWKYLVTLEMEKCKWNFKIKCQRVETVSEHGVKILINKSKTEILHHHCNCFTEGWKNEGLI